MVLNVLRNRTAYLGLGEGGGKGGMEVGGEGDYITFRCALHILTVRDAGGVGGGLGVGGFQERAVEARRTKCTVTSDRVGNSLGKYFIWRSQLLTAALSNTTTTQPVDPSPAEKCSQQ